MNEPNPLRDLPPWDPEEQDREIRRIRDVDARRQRAALAAIAQKDKEAHRRAYMRRKEGSD